MLKIKKITIENFRGLRFPVSVDFQHTSINNATATFNPKKITTPTPTGNPIVPVIKVSTNTTLSEKMPDIIDINAGTIIEGKESIEQAAKRILDYVIDVASGTKESASSRNCQTDFIPWRRGISI